MISLIRGNIRTFFKGFGRDSGFSVKAGVSVCGIRGSDVLISYKPENVALVPPGQAGPVELVGAYVLEGHMDVTNSVTGQTVALTDKQMTAAIDRVISPASSFTQEKWDEWVKEAGLEDMQPLSPEERAAAWSQVTPTTVPCVPSSAGIPAYLVVIIVVAALVVAAVLTTVILLRRKNRQPQEAQPPLAPPADAEPSPAAHGAFCRHCGSPRRPGSSSARAAGRGWSDGLDLSDRAQRPGQGLTSRGRRGQSTVICLEMLAAS